MPAPKRYEVSIYNHAVKESVQHGDPNKTGFSEDWADVRYVEVRAESEEMARTRLHSRYPESRGFVIVDVRLLDPPQ